VSAATKGADSVSGQQDGVRRLTEKASKAGTVDVIVTLALAEPYVPESQLSDRAAIERQRSSIAKARADLLASLSASRATEYKKLDSLGQVALRVDAAGLRLLATSRLVLAIQEDAGPRGLAPEYLPELKRLKEKVATAGTVNVIVGLRLPEPYKPESKSSDAAAIERQRTSIAQVRDALMASLSGTKVTLYTKWDALPMVALRVDAAALDLLAVSSLITTIGEDRLSRPH
jgi:hypothetical protein